MISETKVDEINSNPGSISQNKDQSGINEHNINDYSAYFLVRHSEREDQVKNHDIRINSLKFSYPDDPHITFNGDDIAYQTGRFVCDKIGHAKNERIFDRNIDHEIVQITSPYIRCMQTAFHFVKAFKEKGLKLYKNSLFQEDGIFEWQLDKKFKGKDEGIVLMSDKMDESSLKDYIKSIGGDFHGCDFKKNEILDYQKFPSLKRKHYENKKDIEQRYDDAFTNLAELSFLNKDKYIFICISHGVSIEAYSRMYLNNMGTNYYCATNLIYSKWYSSKKNKGRVKLKHAVWGKSNMYAYEVPFKYKFDKVCNIF